MSLTVQQTRAIVLGGIFLMSLALTSLAWAQIHATLAHWHSMFH